MTDTEKLAAYERILEIIDRQAALENHMKNERSLASEIANRRVGAYKDIVEEIKGVDFRLRL